MTRGPWPLALALLVLASIAPAARAQSNSPWSVRIGGALARLEGALGATYPRTLPAGTFGVAWRTGGSPWRVRTGLAAVTRGGGGDVPVTGILSDSLAVGVVGLIDESWRTTWIELPLQVEFLAGSRRTRPYASAGAGVAWRLPEHMSRALEVPIEDARRVDPTVSVALGLEIARVRGVTRFELGYAHGLSPLYASGRGPRGSWSTWTLVLDVGL